MVPVQFVKLSGELLVQDSVEFRKDATIGDFNAALKRLKFSVTLNMHYVWRGRTMLVDDTDGPVFSDPSFQPDEEVQVVQVVLWRDLNEGVGDFVYQCVEGAPAHEQNDLRVAMFDHREHGSNDGVVDITTCFHDFKKRQLCLIAAVWLKHFSSPLLGPVLVDR